MKKLGYKRSRLISEVLYGLAAIIILYRFLFQDGTAAGRWIVPVGAACMCAGLVVYSLGCRCPKCGRLQPMSEKEKCVGCGTKLQ